MISWLISFKVLLNLAGDPAGTQSKLAAGIPLERILAANADTSALIRQEGGVDILTRLRDSTTDPNVLRHASAALKALLDPEVPSATCTEVVVLSEVLSKQQEKVSDTSS